MSKSLLELQAVEKYYYEQIEKTRLENRIARHKNDLERMNKDPNYDPLLEKLKNL